MESMNEVFEALKSDLLDKQGVISMDLAGISLDIRAKDIIGNSLQEWIGSWFSEKGITYRVLKNSQEFPDYIITFDDIESYLEIKSFNYDKGPAFDLANFNSYIDSLEKNPKKIDADYLILGYSSNSKGFVVKQIFLKKIWEMSGESTVDPLKIQNKKGIVYNIRPMTFYKKPNSTFKNRSEFLKGLTETKRKYSNQGTEISDIDQWEKAIITEYYNLTGKKL
ncbi:Type II restriction enzyme NlaIV [Brachybacterium faecium]|nr:Type II restriction enzyme NlaIV [Brachybacterium faecium]